MGQRKNGHLLNHTILYVRLILKKTPVIFGPFPAIFRLKKPDKMKNGKKI